MIKKSLSILMVSVIISIQTFVVFAAIKESEISNYKAAFLRKILASNPNKETEIRRCMDGFIKNNNSGIRLIDKFALFLYDCDNKGLSVEKIKFYKDGNVNLFIITLKDKSDNGIYSLSLEYTYISAKGSFELSDISFSMIFPDKIKGAAQFFSDG
ncbi:MAG: hypothetical protein FWF73_00310 [Spirochaetes bacterium]|nr:hypothetical protein [Spirochaetota bacterium]